MADTLSVLKPSPTSRRKFPSESRSGYRGSPDTIHARAEAAYVHRNSYPVPGYPGNRVNCSHN
eukprot:2532304-Rhodomonas_salina.1